MATRIKTTIPSVELEVASGNYDETRQPIDRIIIHTMVGTWQGAASRFDDPSSQVSAHYGIKLNGDLIHWLEETFTAYHAGDYGINQRSIGIEHEDGGNYNGVRPDILYKASSALVRDICKFYNIPIDRDHILKHSEVHSTECPDSLDIDRIVNGAKDDLMAVITQAELDAIREARDDNYNNLVQARTVIDNLNSIINDKNNTISSKSVEISSLNQKVVTLQDQNKTLQDQAIKVPALTEQLSQANNSKELCLSAQESQNKAMAQLKKTSYISTPLSAIVVFKLQSWLDRFIKKK